MNKRFFSQKVVIITGSSKGIGKTLAVLLGSMHAKIILNARNNDKLRQTEAELKNLGYDVLAVQGDVTSDEDCNNLISLAVSHYGKIDILVNNAAVSMRGPLESLSEKVLRTSFSLNTVAPLILTQKALPYIKETKGSILFISTLAGLYGLPQISVYSASKMALTAAVQALRVEHHRDKVHFGIVYVGITENEPGKIVLGADGNNIILAEKNRPFQSSSKNVAKSIARAISGRKRKLVLGLPGKIFYILGKYFPNIMELLLIRSQRKIKDIYK